MFNHQMSKRRFKYKWLFESEYSYSHIMCEYKPNHCRAETILILYWTYSPIAGN